MTKNSLHALKKFLRTKVLRAKRRTLTDLPVGLIELIGTKLIDHPTYERLAIPQSTPEGRQAIYNTRSSCRFLYNAFMDIFIEIVQDMPYHCTEEGFRPLLRLLQVPDVSKNIRQLTVGGARMLNLKEEEKQAAWIEGHLTDTLRTILNILPHVASIRCVPMNTYIFEKKDIEESGMVLDDVENNFHTSMAILTRIQNALRMTVHAAAITSFTLRCNYGHDVELEEAMSGTKCNRVTILPLFENPHYDLQHLTVDLECLQTFGANANGHISLPDLETLTIILTRSKIDNEEMVGLDILASTQPQQLTFTGRGSISLSQLYSLVSPFTTRHRPPSHLVLRETAIRLEHGHHDPNPPRPIGFWHTFRINILEIQDVTWNRYVSASSRRRSQGWCETGWDMFPYLCELSDAVRVRISLGGSKKEYLQRPNVAREIEGCSDSDEGADEDEGTGIDQVVGYNSDR
ncbi:hypothetical protein GT037_006484 [Alternaria burnsii]|uniref:Uncharacterized protein n=1 Tax=Alternaria burnsii TaxID=1187904 RepID=A0A8H7EEL9_9PLEO|nr:uncharacterized protein GT037_006484 [Alternaria burnsii]KAF7675765.1 hypothetical protein GT037_006484 [Alternaria burnsii]